MTGVSFAIVSARPPVATTFIPGPSSFRKRATIPSTRLTYPNSSPDWMECTVFFPIGDGGRTRSTRGSFAARWKRASAAIRHLYGGPACCVDFGTATTFDAISVEGDYLGGAIAPGIGIAADALFQRAAKLPRVDLLRPPALIGKNTVHSLQSGLLFGYVSLVEGMVARFRKELGPEMTVVAPGGLAETVAKETTAIDVVAPWLTLDGLRIV